MGKGQIGLREADGRYFLTAQSQYTSNYPKTYNFIKNLIKNEGILQIKLGTEINVPSVKVTGETFDNGKVLETFTEITTLARLERSTTETNFHFLLPKTVEIDDIFQRLQTETLGGLPEVWIGKNTLSLSGGLTLTSSLGLAHELGHASAYLGGEDYPDIPGKLDPNNPLSLGPGVYLENIARKEHGLPIRTAY